jgi:hypothetical protein
VQLRISIINDEKKCLCNEERIVVQLGWKNGSQEEEINSYILF